MARQSRLDKARQMFRAGYGDDDIVADIHGVGGTPEEREATRAWAHDIRRAMRREQEYLDLNRREF